MATRPLQKIIVLLILLGCFFNPINAQCNFQCFDGLIVQHGTNCSEKISWHTPANTESNSMAYFAVDRSINAGATFVQVSNQIPGHPLSPVQNNYSFIDTNPYSSGSIGGNQVYYRVRAVNVDGVSKYSTIVAQTLNTNSCGLATSNAAFCSGTPVLNGGSMSVCDAPQIISISSINPQTTQWSTSNSSILSISSNSFSSEATITPVGVGSAVITAYLPFCNKTVTKTIVVCACPKPITPTNITYTYNSGGNVLTWTAVTNATSYNVQVTDITANPNWSYNVNSSTNGATAISMFLIDGHTYNVKIYAYNSCFISAYSSNYQFTYSIPGCTLAANPSTFLGSNYCGTGNYCSAVQMSWTAVPGAAQYQVDYSVFNMSGSVYGSGTFATTSTSALGNFSYSSGLYFHFRVKVKCASGLWGAYSSYSATFGL